MMYSDHAFQPKLNRVISLCFCKIEKRNKELLFLNKFIECIPD